MPSLAITVCSSLILGLAPAVDGSVVDGVDSGLAAVDGKGAKSAASVSAPEVTAPAVRNPKIAVVNPRLARKKSRWAQSVLAEVEAKTRKDALTLQEMQKKRDKLRKDLELWTKGSRDYQKIQLELGVLGTRMQNASTLFGRWRDEALARALILVRKRVQAAVAKLAKQRGIDLVIQQTQIPANASMDQQIAAMGQQLVLFAKPELDLTTDVVKLMDSWEGAANAAAKKGAGAKAAPKSGNDGKR